MTKQFQKKRIFYNHYGLVKQMKFGFSHLQYRVIGLAKNSI